jgi:hypothetical protein
MPPTGGRAGASCLLRTAKGAGAVVYAQGHNGKVTVDTETGWVTIERTGLGKVGHAGGERRIPIRSITAVQVRPAGRMSNGFIRFAVPGTPEARGGAPSANRDEYAVLFTRKQADQFQAVRVAVEQAMTDLGRS